MTTPSSSVNTAPVSDKRDVSPALLVTLGLLNGIAPFAMDLYLPAFPEMTTNLGTSATGVQLTLTAFLVGAGIGQILFGVLSDRFGRRYPLIVGAAVCVLASLVAALAPTIGILIAARLVQGLTGAAGMAVGRAVISDMVKGKAAARAFSMVAVVGSVAPVVAPLVGSLLVGPLGWRGLLFVLFVFASVMLLAILLFIPETNPAGRRAQSKATRAAGGNSGLGSRAFLANTFTLGFALAGMTAYISASPFVYQVVMGLSPTQYGLMFGANALSVTVVTAVSARLARRVSPVLLLSIGVGVMFCASVVFALLVVLAAPAIWLAVPLLFTVASLGFVFGNATALALGAVPNAAGKGSSVLGAVQFGLSAAVTPLVGLGGENTAAPLALVLCAAASAALGAHLVANWRNAGGKVDDRGHRVHRVYSTAPEGVEQVGNRS